MKLFSKLLLGVFINRDEEKKAFARSIAVYQEPWDVVICSSKELRLIEQLQWESLPD